MLRCVLTTSILYLKVTVHVNQSRLSSWHRLLGYPVAAMPVAGRKTKAVMLVVRRERQDNRFEILGQLDSYNQFYLTEYKTTAITLSTPLIAFQLI